MVVIDTKFVYLFAESGLGVEIFFKKEGATEKWDIDFDIGGACCTLLLEAGENFMQSLSAFLLFYGIRKNFC